MGEEIRKPEETKEPAVVEPTPAEEEVKEVGPSELAAAIEASVEAVEEEVSKEEVKEDSKPKVEETVEEPKEEEVKKPSKEDIEKEVKALVGKPKVVPLSPKVDDKVGLNEAALKAAREYQETQDPAKLVEVIANVGKDIGAQILNSVVQSSTATEVNRIRTEVNEKVYTTHPELIEVAKAAEAAKIAGNGAFTEADVEKALGKPLPPISKTMGDVYREMPNLLHEPDGALKCMKIAEDRLKANPPAKEPEVPEENADPHAAPQADTKNIQKMSAAEIAEAEKARQDKGRAAAAVASGPSPQRTTTEDEALASLTEEDKMFADNLGIGYADYAQRKQNIYVHDNKYYAKYRYSAINKRPSGGGAK